jgi:carboxypeptidase Q
MPRFRGACISRHRHPRSPIKQLPFATPYLQVHPPAQDVIRLLALLIIPLILVQSPVAQERVDIEQYKEAAEKIIGRALLDSTAYYRMAYLADTFGHRHNGSEALEQSIDWLMTELVNDGFANVRGQDVLVPHWVRNDEWVEMVAPRRERLPMLGLGGSVGTPADGITAPVLVVRSFEELEERGAEAAGRIVVFNAAFTTYGETVQYRARGAVEAARHGAVAALIRSVTQVSLQSPHTGQMRYAEGARWIPSAAITIEGAELLQRFQDRGEEIVVTLFMGAETLPDALSRNVIAEFVGRERPEEIVVVGGHIDSWDVGQGAVDDAGGVAVTWEAMRLLKELGLRPRRTIRFVAWTGEEVGLVGAQVYRDSLSAEELANHVLGLESDFGVFAPVGLNIAASDEAYELLKPIEQLFWPILTDSAVFERGINRGTGAPDLIPLIRDGVPGVGVNTDNERYFWYHHAEADTVDKLDPGEMARVTAMIATFIYVVAEMPERLPR